MFSISSAKDIKVKKNAAVGTEPWCIDKIKFYEKCELIILYQKY